MQGRRLPAIAALLTQVMVLAPAARQANQAATDLTPGVPIERELVHGESHRYRVRMAAGEYVRVLVHARTIFVSVTIAHPDGRPIMVSRYQHALRPERVAAVAETSGDHLITVETIAEGDARGSYRVAVEDLRVADTADRARAAAERVMSNGMPRRGQNNAASLAQAKARLGEALADWRTAGDRLGEAMTLAFLASVHGALSEPTVALDLQQQALQIYREIGDRLGEGEVLNNIGVQHFRLSNLHEAARVLEEALACRRELNDRQGLASTLGNIASVYAALSEPAKAIEYNQQLLPLRRSLGDRVGEARTLNNLGTVYSDTGEYQQALESYRMAFALRRAVKDQEGEAYSLLTIGQLHETLGRWPGAQDAAREALRLHRSVGERLGEAQTLRLLARTGRGLVNPQGARAYAEQALTIFKAIGNRAGEGATLTLLAQLDNESGDPESAQRRSADAEKICGAAGARFCQAAASAELGTAAVALRQWERAAAQLASALAIARSIRSPAVELDVRLQLARVERARGRLDAARAESDAALSILESQRTRIASDGLRTSYVATRHGAYASAIDLLMHLHAQDPARGHDAAALETSERARARSLLDLLVEAGADIREGVDATLLAEDRSLRQRLNSLEASRARLLDRPDAEARLAALDGEIRKALADFDRARARIRAASPSYAALTHPQPLTLAAVQRDVLDDETALVQYALGDERSFVWVVTRGSLTHQVLPGRAAIEAAARRAHELLRVSHTRQRRREAERALDALAAMILPAVDRLNVKRLAMAADGALQFVPFGALRAGGAPLVRRFEVVHLPSVSALAVQRHELRQRPRAPKLAAVFADPVLASTDPRVADSANSRATDGSAPAGDAGESDLDATVASDDASSDLSRSGRESGVTSFERLVFTRREADGIRGLTGGADTLVALDFDANRSRALGNDLAQYRYVHFATHGLLNSRYPALSGLVLSLVDEHGRPRDGFVRSHDIYNLRLGADLVVLSACRTALGEEVRGEGLVGLVRGFMHAGAPRVVASLWDVRDEATSVLMERFYAGMIRKGLSPAAALRDAQLSMADHPRWSAPYYWAAFVLQGDWRSHP